MRVARAYRWDLLPRLGRPELAVLRAAAAHFGPGVTAGSAAALAPLLGGRPLVRAGPVRVVPRGELDRQLADAPRVVALLERDGRQAAIALEAQLALALCARLLGVPAAPEPLRALTRAEEGVIGLLVLTGLGAGDGAVRLAGIRQDGGGLAERWPDHWVAVLDLAVEAGEARGGAQVLLPESLLVAAPRRAEAGLARVAALECTLALELGHARLAGAAVAELAAGDVVLMDDLGIRRDDGGPARLRAGRLVVPVMLDAQGVATVSGEPYEGGDMPDNPSIAPPEAARLAALDVEVVAELGRVTLPAREIAALGPGAVVELGRPLGGPVDLRAGGRLLGRGELVDVDGELGVRVIELLI